MSSHSDKFSNAEMTEPYPKDNESKLSATIGLLILIALLVLIMAGTYITFTKSEYEGRRVIYYICYSIIFITCILPILIEKILKTTIGKILFFFATIGGVLFLSGWTVWYIDSLMSTAPPWVFGLMLIYFLVK